jgi:outer membrane protein assembly factor BamD (BamD/ComL family)
MTPEVKELYREGIRKISAKQYEEAIEYFERARQLQPKNKNILDALDSARENLRKQQEKVTMSG